MRLVCNFPDEELEDALRRGMRDNHGDVSKTFDHSDEEARPVFGFGFGELIVILVIIILVFGAGRLPEVGTALGEGIKNFRKGFRDSKSLDVTPEGETPSNRTDPNKK